MFTGIIDHCGEVVEIEQTATGMNVKLSCQFTDIGEGESIAMNGVCVTAITPKADSFVCNLSPETLQKTQFSELKVGTKVNLERALRLSDRLDGHIVTGHVDTCCKLAKKIQHEDYIEFVFSNVDKQHMAYLVDKGSVALNGVSLTINSVTDDGFTIMLIPHTLTITNLDDLTEGQLVNIEFDYLAKLISKRIQLQAEMA